jgi:hypothetical protein
VFDYPTPAALAAHLAAALGPAGPAPAAGPAEPPGRPAGELDGLELDELFHLIDGELGTS